MAPEQPVPLQQPAQSLAQESAPEASDTQAAVLEGTPVHSADVQQRSLMSFRDMLDAALLDQTALEPHLPAEGDISAAGRTDMP